MSGVACDRVGSSFLGCLFLKLRLLQIEARTAQIQLDLSPPQLSEAVVRRPVVNRSEVTLRCPMIRVNVIVQITPVFGNVTKRAAWQPALSGPCTFGVKRSRKGVPRQGNMPGQSSRRWPVTSSI